MTTDDYIREIYLILQSIVDLLTQIYYGETGTIFSLIACLLLILVFIDFLRFIRGK